MKLKTLLERLNKIVEEDIESLELDVVYMIDDMGEIFLQKVEWDISLENIGIDGYL